jgi:hypothetical protein
VLLPEILTSVDRYVKGHLFRDRNQYLQRFTGKSNLTDFVHRHHNYSFADDPIAAESKPLPAGQIGKLRVGWNLAGGRPILRLYEKSRLNFTTSAKTNDVVFRGSVRKDWMAYLRADIEPALSRLATSYRVIAPTARVPYEKYLQEMQTSKICISPFGYGEICWRDFEAILCGCLVIKPDMSHVETVPDIFQPDQTYVPVKWDFSDLEEKCLFFLKNDDERQRIANNAFTLLDEFYKSGRLVDTISNLIRNFPNQSVSP